MVSADRLGIRPAHGNGRIQAFKGGLRTAKNIKNETGSKLGANLKARLSGGVVGGKGRKGQFVLANKFGSNDKVLIRMPKNAKQTSAPQNAAQAKKPFVKLPGKLNKGINSAQAKKPFVKIPGQGNKGAVKQQFVQPANAQRKRPQNQQQHQVVQPQKRSVQQNQNQRQFNRYVEDEVDSFQQNGNRFAPTRQNQSNYRQQQQQQTRQSQSQSNETKLALDIINVLLEDKKKTRRNERREMNWQNNQDRFPRGPETVYIQQAPPPQQQQPIYVQQAPKTVYVDENGYPTGPTRRVVRQPVQVVRRQAPVQVVRRTAPRMVQRAQMQRRLY